MECRGRHRPVSDDAHIEARVRELFDGERVADTEAQTNHRTAASRWLELKQLRRARRLRIGDIDSCKVDAVGAGEGIAHAILQRDPLIRFSPGSYLIGSPWGGQD